MPGIAELALQRRSQAGRCWADGCCASSTRSTTTSPPPMPHNSCMDCARPRPTTPNLCVRPCLTSSPIPVDHCSMDKRRQNMTIGGELRIYETASISDTAAAVSVSVKLADTCCLPPTWLRTDRQTRLKPPSTHFPPQRMCRRRAARARGARIARPVPPSNLAGADRSSTGARFGGSERHRPR